MAAGNHEPELRPLDLSGGTGARFARAIVIVAGSCALVASLITFVCVVSLLFHVACYSSQSTDVVRAALFGYRRKKRPSSDHGSHILRTTRKNYRKPVLQRYVIRILLMYVHSPAKAHSLTPTGCLFTRLHHGRVWSPLQQRPM
jgi:hypothetical protein